MVLCPCSLHDYALCYYDQRFSNSGTTKSAGQKSDCPVCTRRVVCGFVRFSPKAGCLYVLAYLMMITVLRFMDSLEHDYPYRLNLYTNEQSPNKGDLVGSKNIRSHL